MWKLDDIVTYGSAGICRICEIRNEKFCGEDKQYYILKPLFDDKTTLFVPSFNENLMKKIRPVLTYDEAMELIRTIPDISPVWEDNDRMRQEKYRDILESGVREDILSMLKALYDRRNFLVSKGKKLRSSDEIFMRSGEKLIENECAHVLGMELSAVKEFILNQISLIESV